tara:strand:+ start:398 stop:817 length:420 start_codon:yes stop_codon:yes gene_type:complete
MGRFVKNPVLIPGSATGGSSVLPIGSTSQRPANATAGTFRYNNTLNMLEFHNGTEYVQVRGAVSGQHTITVDTFTLDGSTTAYTMSLTPKHERNIMVFMEGVFQKHSTYSISGTTITLTPSYPADASKVVTVLHGFDFV